MFHFVDNNDTAKHSSNKMEKVAPLRNWLNKALTKFGIFHKYLNVDELIVPPLWPAQSQNVYSRKAN